MYFIDVATKEKKVIQDKIKTHNSLLNQRILCLWEEVDDIIYEKKDSDKRLRVIYAKQEKLRHLLLP